MGGMNSETKNRIELNSKPNSSCITKCGKEFRKTFTENDLCNIVTSTEDDLPVRCVGEWAEQKIYLLSQYFGIFAGGMKNKWKDKLNYIEICSGPGRCINRTNGNEFDGTALCILKNKNYKYINKALFFDFNETVIDALKERIKNIGVANAKSMIADYANADDLCSKLCSETTHNSLNLVFIDPTDCSVPFELLIKIKATLPNVDFIVNVATGTDFTRNIPMAFGNAERAKKYSGFLGDNSFFSDLSNISLYEREGYSKLRELFRLSYQKSLQKIGFNHFDTVLVNHYYDILFAASHPTAIKFWKEATKIKFDGQRELF